jgi:hypothetical protein
MLKMCEYKFRNGERCKEKALPNSNYCILHVDLPEDEESEEFERINGLKKEKVKEKIEEGDFNFESAKLFEVDFSEMEIEGDANFANVVVIKDAGFEEAKIGGFALFDNAEIGGNAWFGNAEIGGTASFGGAKIGGDTCFDGAKIGRDAGFPGAEIGRDAWFDKAEIGRHAWFNHLEIKGKLSFRDTKFEKPEAQEESCRKAKRVWEEFGDRIEVDYYFYREMEAKRKQKHPIIRFFLELPIQYIFGYGVYPWRVIATWFITVFSLAFVYWLGKGVVCADGMEHLDLLSEYIYFSIVTAATPGYGGYKPVPGFYQNLASFEAIFGTFMWAAFIATFARKYMR